MVVTLTATAMVSGDREYVRGTVCGQPRAQGLQNADSPKCANWPTNSLHSTTRFAACLVRRKSECKWSPIRCSTSSRSVEDDAPVDQDLALEIAYAYVRVAHAPRRSDIAQSRPVRQKRQVLGKAGELRRFQ